MYKILYQIAVIKKPDTIGSDLKLALLKLINSIKQKLDVPNASSYATYQVPSNTREASMNSAKIRVFFQSILKKLICNYEYYTLMKTLQTQTLCEEA